MSENESYRCGKYVVFNYMHTKTNNYISFPFQTIINKYAVCCFEKVVISSQSTWFPYILRHIWDFSFFFRCKLKFYFIEWKTNRENTLLAVHKIKDQQLIVANTLLGVHKILHCRNILSLTCNMYVLTCISIVVLLRDCVMSNTYILT